MATAEKKIPKYLEEVTDRVYRVKNIFVNVYLVGLDNGDWFLVDAGLKGFSKRIINSAKDVFGDRPPKAIVLTHAHFDHIGSLQDLLKVWNVEVFAHKMEIPFIEGLSQYPPADPAAGRGMMAFMSRVLPRGPIYLGDIVTTLEDNQTIPGMEEWKVISTPGHTPGHISLFREKDRLLIAGDAVITQNQESLIAVFNEEQIIQRPPAYFTPDWFSASNSIAKLVALEPEILATGHGKPMQGEEIKGLLHSFGQHFNESEIPKKGRYHKTPATFNERGVYSVPPKPFDPVPWALAAVGTVAVGYLIYRLNKRYKISTQMDTGKILSNIKALPVLNSVNLKKSENKTKSAIAQKIRLTEDSIVEKIYDLDLKDSLKNLVNTVSEVLTDAKDKVIAIAHNLLEVKDKSVFLKAEELFEEAKDKITLVAETLAESKDKAISKAENVLNSASKSAVVVKDSAIDGALKMKKATLSKANTVYKDVSSNVSTAFVDLSDKASDLKNVSKKKATSFL